MSIAKHEGHLPVAPAPHSTGANLIRESAAVMADAYALAQSVCATSMVPAHFRDKPEDAAAAMLLGASLDLDPMQALRSLYVVHGQPAFYARAMVALVTGKGHRVWTVETSDESVTVAAQRSGSEHVEQATWTYARAKRAGYTNNKKYETDPQAMLYAKAASEVCRKVAPDVLTGLYAVEELQLERWEAEVTHVERGGGLAAALASPTISGAEEAPEAGHQVEPPPTSAPESPPESPLLNTSSKLAKAMYAAMNEAGIPKDGAHEFFTEVTGRTITSSKELTEDEARQVLDHLPAQDDPLADVPTPEPSRADS